MKDYKLSEIKRMCEEAKGDCSKCVLGEKTGYNYFCEICGYDYQPVNWDIDEDDHEK